MNLDRRRFIGLVVGALAAPAALFEEETRNKFLHAMRDAFAHGSKDKIALCGPNAYRAMIAQLYPDSPAPIMGILEKLKAPPVDDPEYKVFEWHESRPFAKPKEFARLPRRGLERNT